MHRHWLRFARLPSVVTVPRPPRHPILLKFGFVLHNRQRGRPPSRRPKLGSFGSTGHALRPRRRSPSIAASPNWVRFAPAQGEGGQCPPEVGFVLHDFRVGEPSFGLPNAPSSPSLASFDASGPGLRAKSQCEAASTTGGTCLPCFTLETLRKGNHRNPVPFVGFVLFAADDCLRQPPPPASRLSVVDASRRPYVPYISTSAQEF